MKKEVTVYAQILYNFAERGEMVDPEKLQDFGRDFYNKIKVRGINKRLAMYIDSEGNEHVVPVAGLPQDMLAWAAFLRCFHKQTPLDDIRLQERYGLKNTIYNTLIYVSIMEKYSRMKEKNMEILDLEDIIKAAIPEIRGFKGIN